MSTLRVNNIANSSGVLTEVNGYPRQPGQIIEQFSSPCDGSAITVGSGSYTMANVLSGQNLDSTYVDITGSSISYTPPAGTTRVIYRFNFALGWFDDSHSIAHIKFYFDGNEVVYARRAIASMYTENTLAFEWAIAIGGTTDTNTGRVSSWTSPKIMKMQAREYGTSDEMYLHQTHYWDGTTANYLSMPVLSVTAIA